jgi:hypothetical protein
MRHLILLLIATTLVCAEWSQLTLRDGRVLVGSYDVAAQILDMGCAQIAIAPADIASVSPATRPAAKRTAVVEPTQKAADLVRLRAEADAAATAYAAATLAYYQAAYAGVPRPVAMAPNDSMTMAEHRAASAAQCLPEAWDQLGNAIATLVKHAASPAPVTRAIRAAQFDYALTFGGDSAARRKLLGMPEPKD